MARTDPQFNIRIPVELKEKLDAHAKACGRSMTTDVIAIIEEKFSDDSEARLARLEEKLDEVLRRLDAKD